MTCTVDIGQSKACVALIDNIGNGKDIIQRLMEGSLSSALLSCDNILDLWQLTVAAFKAHTAEREGNMATRNVYSEIIYQLSPNRQISQSFKLFGMQATDTSCIAITLGESRESDMNDVMALAKESGATSRPLEDLNKFHSLETIKKTYKIQEDELVVGTLSDAVVSRIAAKNMLT